MDKDRNLGNKVCNKVIDFIYDNSNGFIIDKFNDFIYDNIISFSYIKDRIVI